MDEDTLKDVERTGSWRELELIAEVRRLQLLVNRAKHTGASCMMLGERCNALEKERDEARAQGARLQDMLKQQAINLRDAMDCNIRLIKMLPD